MTSEMAAAHRTRARRGEGGLLREELLAAADALLVETASEEAVSIRAIAERVGVTPPSIYRHFADKDALMYAVCQRTFGRLDEAMEKAAAPHRDPYEALAIRGVTYVRFGLEHPEHYRVFFLGSKKENPELAPEVEDERLQGEDMAGTEAFNHLAAVAEALLGRRRSPTPVELACEIWAFVHGVTSLRINFPTMPWPPLEQQVGGYVDGLRARFAKR